MNDNNKEHKHCGNHECGTLFTELVAHFPYAVFSVALSFIGVALLNYFSFGAAPETVRHGSHVLFHTFHFMHIVFAAAGAMLTYFRYSKKIIEGVVIGGLSTIVFCILSDVLFPYMAGWLLGVHMHLHICFVSELHNVLPFLAIGMITGWILAQDASDSHTGYSLNSHFAHIFVSSFASIMYMVSHGFTNWENYMGAIFVLLIFAVVVPCTMSDVVVPLYFARSGKR